LDEAAIAAGKTRLLLVEIVTSDIFAVKRK